MQTNDNNCVADTSYFDVDSKTEHIFANKNTIAVTSLGRMLNYIHFCSMCIV